MKKVYDMEEGTTFEPTKLGRLILKTAKEYSTTVLKDSKKDTNAFLRELVEAMRYDGDPRSIFKLITDREISLK